MTIQNTATIYNTPGVYNKETGLYNGAGVYNVGAGGGGGNTITIDGYTYNFVQVGSLYWITENLRVNAPNAVTYRQQQDINEYGLYYQPATDFPVIESLLTDGWRIATRGDFLNLYAVFNNNDAQFIKNCFSDRYANAENLSGLNLLSCGYKGGGGNWYLDTEWSIMWTKTIANSTYYYDLYTQLLSNSISISGNFMSDYTHGASQYRCVARICKDV